MGGPKGFPQTFKAYMDANSNLRTMIAEGRGNLEWERKIPDDKLAELKDMLSTWDFKANMPKIIKRIYELSWDMFGDLPRGHHKNNSMHKLASKTMIEIFQRTWLLTSRRSVVLLQVLPISSMSLVKSAGTSLKHKHTYEPETFTSYFA